MTQTNNDVVKNPPRAQLCSPCARDRGADGDLGHKNVAEARYATAGVEPGDWVVFPEDYYGIEVSGLVISNLPFPGSLWPEHCRSVRLLTESGKIAEVNSMTWPACNVVSD